MYFRGSMSTILNILSTEITPIPTWISATLGGYYDNTLCNEATWMLVLWKVLHMLYNGLIHGYFNKMGTNIFIRTRLTTSFWYCGFFSSILTYYLFTFNASQMNLLPERHEDERLPFQVVLMYIVMCTFYLHTALLEGIQNGSFHLFVRYLLLVAVCVSTYICRLLEISFTLSALIAVSVISEEMTKNFHSLLRQDNNKLNYVFVRTLYFLNLTLFTLTHLIAIPSIFVIPLGQRITSKSNDTIFLLLFSSLLLWICSALYNSILSRSILHWLYHVSEKLHQEEQTEEKNEKMECPGNIIECSMFSPRTDDAYVLSVLRFEIRERKKEMEARKKPKSKNMMIIQTLKCMMAIKKKLSKRKLTRSASDSAESSEAEDRSEYDNAADVDAEDEDSDDDGVIKIHAEKFKKENREDTTENINLGAAENLQSKKSKAFEGFNIQTVHCSDFESESYQDNEVYESIRKSEASEVGVVHSNVCVIENDLDKALKLGEEVQNKPTTVVDRESNSKNKMAEDIKLDKTTGSIEKDNNRDREEVEESKSTVKISGSVKNIASEAESKITVASNF